MYKTIREIVEKLGSDIIISRAFLHCMDDYHAFDDVDLKVYKKILLAIINDGYSQKLLRIGAWNDQAKMLSKECARKNGFGEDKVSYMFQCLAFGLEWIQNVPRLDEIQNNAQPSKVTPSNAGFPTAAPNRRTNTQQVLRKPNTQEIPLPSVGVTRSNGIKKATITVNKVSFDMVYVEGGTFTMGAEGAKDLSELGNESPAHQVTLSDFYIGETLVTQALWKAVIGNYVKDKESFISRLLPTDDLPKYPKVEPVRYVSWDLCQEFIWKLSQLTGKSFRMPTEAEWEYAARGGNKSCGYSYAGSNLLSEVAWYRDNSLERRLSVKLKKPNELGLYDMSGYLNEWCSDYYDLYKSSFFGLFGHSQINPQGPDSADRRDNRVIRGGDEFALARKCRVTARDSWRQTEDSCTIGLRLVMEP